MKVGIISFEHMHAHAYAHAMTTLPGHELVGIADDDPVRGKQVAEQYNTQYFADYNELLAQPIDAVFVCSANMSHHEHVVAAAKAGKHVLCEKPIAVTVAEAQEMIDAANEANVILRTAFPMRHSPPVERLREVVQSGAIGEVIALAGTNRGKMPGGWFIQKERSGGGAVFDHTVHVADLIRWITKDEFVRVYAESDTLIHDIDIDDCGMLVMDLASGAIASLDPSWSRPANFPTWGDVTLEIVGTKGVAATDAFNQKGLVYVSSGDGKDQFAYEPWGINSDAGMIQSFIDAIEGKQTNGATGHDGLKATEVAIAAYESVKQGKAVELPL